MWKQWDGLSHRYWYVTVSEELSSVETLSFHSVARNHILVSEELSSVETSIFLENQVEGIEVSEELSSVETKEVFLMFMFQEKMFQKNLVVWKLLSFYIYRSWNL